METSKEFLNGLTDKQKEVVETPSGNVLVSAAAGSGKTFVLTRRVMHLLKDEGYSLDDMVVLTFTDLAAKEMKDRITKALKNTDDPRLKEELNHIDEANISTFDSFCHKFLIENIIYSKFPKNFNIGDDALFAMKEDKFLDEIIEEWINANNVCIDGSAKTNSRIFIEDLNIDNVDQLKQIVKNVYKILQNKKSPIEETMKYLNPYNPNKELDIIKSILNPYLRTKILSLKSYIKETPIDGVNKVWNTFELYVDDGMTLNTFDERVEFFNKGLPTTDRFTGKRLQCDWEGLSKDEQKPYDKDLKKFKEEFKKTAELTSYFDGSYDVIKELKYVHTLEYIVMSFVNLLINKINCFKKDYSLYTFQDIEVECIRILTEHGEIRNRYKSKIKEFLIDEYQDTNDIQSELISLISNNNVVVVGDIKQSIYRFRNANPALFGNLKNKYANDKTLGTVIELNKNFRSRDKEVLQVSNNIFNPLAIDPDLDSFFFADKMVQGNDNYTSQNSSPLNKFNILEYQYDKEEKKSNEYEVLATDILNRVNSKQLIFDKDLKYVDEETGEEKSGKFREIEFSDIMILSHSSTKFGNVKKAFEKYGIPTRIIAEEEYSTSEEIIFLKNTLKMINLLYKNAPMDDKEHAKEKEDFLMTLLSILRSFVIKENDNKIVDFLADEKPILVKFESYFPSLYSTLQNLVDVYKAYGTSVLFNEIVNKFKAYQCIKQLEKKESRELKINILINQISTYAKSGMSLDEIINYFDYVRMNETEINQKLSSFETLKCVTVMTIHKSKGLEAPVVYVIGLNTQFQPWRHIKHYSNELGICLKGTLKYIVNNLVERRENNIELFRLLYVAITRPRESLTLLSLEDTRTTEQDVYNFGSLMDLINYAAVFKEDTYRKIEVAEPYSDNTPPSIDSKSLVYNSLSLKEKELITRKKASHDVEIEVSKEVTDALDKGTLLHSFFEVTDFLAPDFDKELDRKMIATDWIPYLKQFKDSFLFKTPSIREFHELPYYGEDESGVIDYLLEKDNEYIIVDFKTSNIDNPAYITQLNTYKDYLKTKTDKPIKMYLYSIMKNIFKKVEDL